MKISIQEGHPALEVVIQCPQADDTVHKIKTLLHSQNQKLPCTLDGATHFIDPMDTLYFESVDKRSYLYTAKAVYETPLRLYEIEALLADALFIRSAKAQIINLAQIQSLCPDFGGRIEAVLTNGEKLIVSRQYAKNLKERLNLS
ncbi:MAG: LytTR family transcriptional regulator DNA-binding domain-containing protein [Defluviitaleaceae bacterium]|nr:LytTR family transcriptional regulator DNA-binding domain-containing protein [Defluviitaleaceae bacterium]